MQAKIYSGDFLSLARQINSDQASLRIDCHFNSGSSDVNYSQVAVAKGNKMAMAIGLTLVNLTVHKLGIKNNGVKALSQGQRGYPIFREMNCPTLLWEPCFCTNPAGAETIKHKRWLLHEAFLETINHHFQSDALIALVAGHAHKRTGDSGTSVHGGGTEAEYTALLVKELCSLINSTSKGEDDMPAFQAVPSKKNEREVWYDGLFTGRGDWGIGRVFMTIRVDPDDLGAMFKYIIIPKDKNKFPALKWSESITIEPDNRPVEIEFPQDIGNFSLHVKSEDNPILTAVNQMY